MLKKQILIICSYLMLLINSCVPIFDDGYSVQDNPLSATDSIAVRAILDVNGLDTVNVRNVVSIKNSFVTEINLDNRSLKKFIFCKYFDSFSVYSNPDIILRNNNLDTLIFADSIQSDMGIRLEYNNVKSIPDDINKLCGEFSLYVTFNSLSSISENIMHCNVYYINVDSNYLCNVSDTMKQWLNTKTWSTAWQARQKCE
jgi:hypothetical protein